MKKVFIYKFKGTYSGASEYDYHAPEKGQNHTGLIFIAQENDAVSISIAEEEIRRFGFVDIENLDGRPMSVESLNTHLSRGFTGFYEEALSEGSSLVYYPNT